MHLITLFFIVLVLEVTAVQGAEYRLVGNFPVAVKEPSGLTYDPKNDSLWTVRDGGGNVFELDKKGNILKEVPLESNDLEGIAYKSDTDTFLLAEERKRLVVEIDREGKILKTIKVPIEWRYWNLNKGIEGVGYDAKNKIIFAANEKNPRRVMELKEDGSMVDAFEINAPEADHLSDLYYDADTDNLLVLSRTIILEYTRKGKLLKTIPIEAKKAEGMTKDGKDNLYILCEETCTLYVYAPETAPTP